MSFRMAGVQSTSLTAFEDKQINNLPLDPLAWTVSTEEPWDEELNQRTLDDVAKRWESLAPFFLSHGYSVYDWKGNYRTVPSEDSRPPLALNDSAEAYPYGWSPLGSLKDNRDYAFFGTRGYRIWPARDTQGREVLIRLVSFPGSESEELRIYRQLNTPESRQDSRNHTLPVLAWLQNSGLTFVVLPRWGEPAVGLRCLRAEQLLQYAETVLECLLFLHENRIAHRDIHFGNIVWNVMTGHHLMASADVIRLDLDAVRFAIIDFDSSISFPMSAQIDSVVLEREMRAELMKLGLPKEAANPFHDDVFVTLNVLQRHVRVLESELPEVGVFFDNHLKEYPPPPASEVLNAFRKAISGISEAQLVHVPKLLVWFSEAEWQQKRKRKQKRGLVNTEERGEVLRRLNM